jgi:hypothetical protein
VDKTCVEVAISGVTPAGGGSAASNTIKVMALKGDMNSDGMVQNADIIQVKARSSFDPITSANFKYDVNLDGLVQNADIIQVKALSSFDTWACGY